MSSERRLLASAMAGSILAAIIIEAILFVVILRGLEYLFTPHILPGLTSLLVIAGYVYTKLLRSAKYSRPTVRVAGLLGAVVAGLGVAVGVLGRPYLGAWLIIAAYYGELVLGFRLRRDLEEHVNRGVNAFIGGMLVFILSLPLAVVDHRLAVIPFIGNLVKTLGLIQVYRELSSRG
ncbi:MAG: hypothetical protein F7C08_02840 [Desulfurococcales archaeon]|nr:hypothetical protein [Desulfurococcales archaeon]MCE4605451.1 hypothetical protein [Desulfurococcales archaeon]